MDHLQPAAMIEKGDRHYPWLDGPPGAPLWKRHEPPSGFTRIPSGPGTFANWLRNLPLKPGVPEVHLHDGNLKYRQDVHVAVVDIDVGSRDLQQCVDACMRLWAEYLWSEKREGDICFRSVGGLALSWTKWRSGVRPDGNKWKPGGPASGSYESFRSYLNKVFGMANTRSALEQMIKTPRPDLIEIGDVFINRPDPGSFGHAVIVVDAAENADGRRVFLLAQSYMPAQEIHILKNPEDADLSPWYVFDRDRELRTPEWSFEPGTLRRFPPNGCGTK